MPAPHVGIRVDASQTIGVGHSVRMLALGQELRSRGAQVSVFGDLGGVGWVIVAYAAAGLVVRPAADLPAAPLTHLVIDGYPIPASVGRQARARGIRTLAMIDESFGAHQVADIYVDQNYAAQPPLSPPVPDAEQLIGIDYAIFRDIVRDRRGQAQRTTGTPRVLAVFGGTDPFGASARIVPLLLATGLPVHILAVCPRAELASSVRALTPGPGQQVEVIGSVPDLPAIAVTCHAAVSAAGTTIWELLCLGLPTASVCVTANQEPGYLTTVADEVTLGGGRLHQLDDVEERRLAQGAYARLLGDPALRDRLAAQGTRLVDGNGRERVAAALLAPPPA